MSRTTSEGRASAAAPAASLARTTPPAAGALTTSPAASALTWSVAIDPPMSGARNMSRDHALVQAVQDGQGVLRIYRWDRPTVSFGRNEPARGRYDLDAAARRGVHFVRRPTGGRAVLHDRELTYAVALPLRAMGGARRAYMVVNVGLVRALRSLGVSAELAAFGEPCAPDAGPCFQRAAPGEVVVSGRKLVGSAQVRLGNVLLQHGSLLLGPGQELLGELCPQALPARDSPVSLSELLGRAPDWDDLVEAVVDGLSQELGGRWDRLVESSTERRSEEALLERYGSDVWTWRR